MGISLFSKAIATTKIPKGEKAWDMKSNMYENGLIERLALVLVVSG